MKDTMIVVGFVFAIVAQVAVWGTLIFVALHFVQKLW